MKLAVEEERQMSCAQKIVREHSMSDVLPPGCCSDLLNVLSYSNSFTAPNVMKDLMKWYAYTGMAGRREDEARVGVGTALQTVAGRTRKKMPTGVFRYVHYSGRQKNTDNVAKLWAS